MDIITGYLGEAHVTAEQDRDVNIGVVGDGSYVMPAGQRLAAEVQTNNEVRIRDGVLIHQGCAASIKKNTYDTVTIANGSQGMKRIDLIVARYQRNVETGVESLDLIALQGTPAESDPAVPKHTEGDIQAGDAVADMPLYEVEKDGLNITRVTKVFEEVESLSSLNGKTTVTVLESGENTIYLHKHGKLRILEFNAPIGNLQGYRIPTDSRPSKTKSVACNAFGPGGTYRMQGLLVIHPDGVIEGRYATAYNTNTGMTTADTNMLQGEAVWVVD